MIRRRRVKTWVLTGTLFALVAILMCLTAMISTQIFTKLNVDNDTYVLHDLLDSSLPVSTEVEKNIVKPYSDETVKVHISYYDESSEAKVQEKSIILYENTYMPNTGILYGSENTFNVLSCYEGEVTNITTDEVFGTIIEIKHDNNLISKYSSLTSADVAIGDTVQAGEVIGTSGINKVASVSKNMLLFELIYNGEYVNPDNYYDKEIESLD